MSNLRLRTTKETENKLLELQIGLQLSTKAAVMRLAIGIALQKKLTMLEIEQLINQIRTNEHTGGDYMRYTVFPVDELIFKVMIEEQLNKYLDDDKFFPDYVNAYIVRGTDILYSNLKLYKKDKIYDKIFNEGVE
jgi:hypothetical protein